MAAMERHRTVGLTPATYPRCQKINLLKCARRPTAGPPKRGRATCKMSLHSGQLNLRPHY